jgi:hypothetical protein
MLHRHAGDMWHKHEAEMQHRLAAWTSSLDMHHGHAAWRLGYDTWTSSIDKQHVQAAWTCILDMQYAYHINTNTNAKIYFSPVIYMTELYYGTTYSSTVVTT